MRVLAAAAMAFVLAAALAAQQPRQPVPPTPPSRPAQAARREPTVPFAIGETLTFDVSWSQFLTAGTATTQVVEKKASFNSSAYSLVAEGRPVPLVARFYPVFYKMETLLDSVTTLSQWTSLYQEENARKRQTTMRFDRAGRRVYYEMPTQPGTKADFPAPANVQDGLALLYTLRTREFKANEHFAIPVADDGSLYTAQFETTGPEHVLVHAGQFDAWNLRVTITDEDRQPVGKNIGLWISADAHHLPVKIQADLPLGSFVFALRDAH